MDVIEGLVIELESEIAKGKSWATHYDELDYKFEILCDALYKIRNLDPAEEEACGWIANEALLKVGK
jgi:hypothetical protein